MINKKKLLVIAGLLVLAACWRLALPRLPLPLPAPRSLPPRQASPAPLVLLALPVPLVLPVLPVPRVLLARRALMRPRPARTAIMIAAP